MNDKILKTTDGGINWVGSPTQGSIANWDVKFIDQSTGYAVGLYANMFKSSDGGISWEQSIEPMVASLFGVEFMNDSVGFIIGGSQIAKTVNKGETWNIVYNIGNSQLNSIQTIGDKYSWAVGSDKILYTSNTGASWVQQSFSLYSNLQQISCIDSLNAWILGDRKLYRTLNGGITEVEYPNKSFANNYVLNQNYPNPFNPTTNIEFRIAEFGFVSLKVYDILGREVATLVHEEKPTGNYKVEFNGSGLVSGVYFYKLNAEDYTAVKKMILLK